MVKKVTPRAASRRPGGMIAVYRPLFRGEGPTIAVLAAVSFFGGISEAGLLVVVANLAFIVGGDTGGMSLGPFGTLHLSVPALFWTALGLGVVRTLMATVTGHLTARIAARRTTELRAATYSDYARASWAEQASMDEAAVQDLLLRYVTRVVNAAITVAGGLPVLSSLIALVLSAVAVDPVSAVVVVATGALLFLVLRPLSARAKHYSALQASAGRRYIERSMEAIGLSLEFRAFGVNREVAEDLDRLAQREARPVYVNIFLQRLVSALYQMAAVTVVLVGLLAVYLFLDRPLASLSAIVVILVRAMNQASTLQSVYHSLVESSSFAEDLTATRQRFLASEPRSGEASTPARARLRFDHVSYRYRPDVPPALDDVSFTVEPGEAVGVIGPSGSGKSTLIQVLLRLRGPSGGRFLIDGVDSDELDDDVWFRQVAFVPQESRVMNASMADNIRFYRPFLTQDDIVTAAKRANVHEEILAMASGYDTVLGHRGGSLSGGQRQRVSIARALASNPQVVVLDEPTSALDMRSEALVHQALVEMQGSVTLLVIAHRLSTLRTCDRIMVLGDGRLQAFGTRSELEASSPFYRDAIALSKLRS